MGKNYVENSLKRFLKRKVKITLGFVVAFMISGTVGFADIQVPDIQGEGAYIPYNSSIQGIGNKEEILSENIVYNGKEILKSEDINNLSEFMGNKAKEVVKNSIFLIKNALSAGNSENDYNFTGDLLNDNENYLIGLNYKGNNIINAGETKHEFSLERVFVNGKEIYYAAQVARENETAVNKGIIAGGKPADFTEPTDGTAYGIGQYAEGKNAKVYNYGIIETSNNNGQRAREGAEAYNYGIILGQISQGQNIVDSYGYNYGIVANKGDRGQAANGTNSFVYNYGIIKNTGKSGQNGLFLENHGIIANSGEWGQRGDLNNTKLYNYGLIANNAANGQIIKFGNYNNYGEAYNYGVIKNNGDNGQMFESNQNQGIIYNYGLIANNGEKGQTLGSNTGGAISSGVKSYNYGIIANTGSFGIFTDDAGTSYNYGIVANQGENSLGGEGDINNNGIVINNKGAFANIGDKGESKNVKNNGVVIVKNKGIGLKEAYYVHNNGIQIDAKNTNDIKITVIGNTMFVATNQADNIVTNDKKFTGILSENKNLFVDRYTKGKLTDTLTLDNKTLTGNHITTVVGTDDTSDKAVISTKDDLILNNSSIVGYFEKEGTLLEVKGDLTLSGNSIINAIAGNEYTGYTGNSLEDKVVAVKLYDNGVLTISENSKVLGKVEGNGTTVLEDSKEKHLNGFDIKSLEIKTTEEKGTDTKVNNLKLSDGLTITGAETSKENTKIVLGNNIDIKGGISFIEHGAMTNLGADITLGDGGNIDKTINIDNITLGSGQDILTIQNVLGKVGTIDGGAEDDTIILKNINGNHDTFDYALKNVETLDLNKQTWKIGENASIEFGNSGTTTKTTDKITVQNGTLMGEMKFDIDENGNSAEFSNDNIDDVLSKTEFSTEKGKEGYLQLGIGENSELQAGAEYDMNITDETKQNLENMKDNITVSGIFDKGTGKNEIRVKTAEEMGINGRYSELYNQMLENADKEEVRDVLNNVNSSDIADVINSKGAMADTLATSGYKITRDISNSFISSVNEWNKKANKGEWLANAKYINSDVEYDGANSVKGYDSDITSMVGMIEYGVSDNTSYGVALGGGDTEVDVNGAGTLEGDNYYIGAYAKHSVNGFDLVGNLGYTISDLEVDGNGSADSSAITLAGYVKRDIRLSETVKIEPNLAFTYDYIMQDDAEGNGVKVENKDVHVFEATAGMNIVKEFAFNNGNLELKAGIKYSMADINRNEETIMVNVLNTGNTTLGNPEVDKTRGTVHIGFDYEHETGFGVNGKYETMWSDSGDDSRITAGVSYRF